jgi:Protein of unknown function (DUF2752)
MWARDLRPPPRHAQLSPEAMKAPRTTWFGMTAASATVLGISRALTPDPSGFGTHVQLGLPHCFFLRATGLPCPACGLTTAFAHMARGQVAQAASANALGVLLFAIVCCSVPLGVWAGVRDLPLSETFTRVHAAKSCSAIAIIGLVYWCARVTWIVVH